GRRARGHPRLPGRRGHRGRNEPRRLFRALGQRDGHGALQLPVDGPRLLPGPPAARPRVCPEPRAPALLAPAHGQRPDPVALLARRRRPPGPPATRLRRALRRVHAGGNAHRPAPHADRPRRTDRRLAGTGQPDHGRLPPEGPPDGRQQPPRPDPPAHRTGRLLRLSGGGPPAAARPLATRFPAEVASRPDMGRLATFRSQPRSTARDAGCAQLSPSTAQGAAMSKSRTRVVARLGAIALALTCSLPLMAASRDAQADSRRSYDAREALTVGKPDASLAADRAAAVEQLRAQVPDLRVTTDYRTGATR